VEIYKSPPFLIKIKKMNIEVQIIIKNEFGEFFGKKIIMDEENYQRVILISKDFYKSKGFELTCEDDSFLVFPPDVVQRSILKISSKKINEI
jgi:hypothetical protein